MPESQSRRRCSIKLRSFNSIAIAQYRKTRSQFFRVVSKISGFSSGKVSCSLFATGWKMLSSLSRKNS